jgi:GNAT superfamily N-acetyltransferase
MMRPPADHDLDAWIALWNLTQPWPRERALMLQQDALRPPDERSLRLAAWAPDGALVGLAELVLRHGGYRSAGLGRAAVGVDPSHRRRGLGTELANAIDRFARECQLERILLAIHEHDLPASGQFLQRRGCTELGRRYQLVQDPAAVDLSELPPLLARLASKGIETVAFSEIDSPENRRQLWRVVCAIERDVPSRPQWDDPDFEAFEQDWFSSSVRLAGPPFVARDRGEIVGLTDLVRRPSTRDRAHVGLTGVLPAYRRRGIARTLKLLSTRYARGHGFIQVSTTNDDANTGMLALNRELGFRPGPVAISLEKRFSSP